jgi:Tat protein secretion system quality control protein TatD with DNase activity
MKFHPVIDCHAHITTSFAHLKNILRRCEEYEVEAVVYSVDCRKGKPDVDIAALHKLREPYKTKLFVSLGESPVSDLENVASWDASFHEAIETVKKLSQHELTVAIGEVGLDYYWPIANFLSHRGGNEGRPSTEKEDKEDSRTDFLSGKMPQEKEDAKQIPEIVHCLESQRKYMQKWVALAVELGLPLVLHIREAYEDAFAILSESKIKPKQVMFHCFSGSLSQASKAMELGYYVSIPSSVVYREPYRTIAKTVDMSLMLLETDSPYHSPFVGLWKRCFEEAGLEAKQKKLTGRSREEWVQKEKVRRFQEIVEETLPHLVFESATPQGFCTVPAQEYLLHGGHRYRNEPAFVRCAAIAIAQIKNCTPQLVCNTTTANAKRFYRICDYISGK